MKTMNDKIEDIKKCLSNLGLTLMKEIIEEKLLEAQKNSWSHTDLLEHLFQMENEALIQRRIERRIVESRLPERKLLSDFDFNFQPSLDKTQIMELATLNFVKSNQGLIIAGSSGSGKSHIAKALLLIGCKLQYRCLYTTSSLMLKHLISGLPDDTLEKKLKKYLNPDILLIDELGFDRIEQDNARNASLFFKVIDGRYGKKTTMMTTNVDFKELGDYLDDPVVTTAIVDRMVHHSTIINVIGPSWRMHQSSLINKTNGNIRSNKKIDKSKI